MKRSFLKRIISVSLLSATLLSMSACDFGGEVISIETDEDTAAVENTDTEPPAEEDVFSTPSNMQRDSRMMNSATLWCIIPML